MTPFKDMVDNVASTLPAYPADRVEAVASSLAEPVLWSGRALGADGVEALVGMSAASWLASVALFTVAGLILLISRPLRRMNWRSLSAGILALLGLIAVVVADDAMDRAHDAAGRGYVITERRVVRIDGPEGRLDIPAGNVTSIRRFGEGATIGFTSGQAFEIQIPHEARAKLDGALDRFADARFRAVGLMGQAADRR